MLQKSQQKPTYLGMVITPVVRKNGEKATNLNCSRAPTQLLKIVRPQLFVDADTSTRTTPEAEGSMDFQKKSF